jgi:hypothetical protein
MRARAACVIRLTVAGNGDAQDVEVFSAIGDPVMNPATQLKRGSAVFTVFWIAGMLWWNARARQRNRDDDLRSHRRLRLVSRHALATGPRPVATRPRRRLGSEAISPRAGLTSTPVYFLSLCRFFFFL